MPLNQASGLSRPVRAGATGNVCEEVFQITGNGNGGTAAAGSVFQMASLPRGLRILNLSLDISADTAGLTVSAGYSDQAGVAAAVPAAFINAGTTLAVATVPAQRNNPANPALELPRDSNITVTTAGAIIAANTVLTMKVRYTNEGQH